MEQEKKAHRLTDGIHFGWYIALALVVLLQAGWFTYRFMKPGMAHFIDCYFRYGLANSYYKPFMDYGSDGYFWTSGEEISHYLMPTDGTRFKYDSVWYNQECDVNPPLYYVVLHTLCSIFPENFSWWYGLSINIICFAVMQFFLFKLINLICKSPGAALAIVFFYGFTNCNLSNQVLIGMYSMLTMFAVVLTYITAKMLEKEKLSIKTELIPIMVIVFCGSMTQHIYLIYAFFFTLFTCIYFLLRKRIYNCFSYGIAALIGVVLSFAVFPAGIEDMFGSGSADGVFSPLRWEQQPDFKQNKHMFFRILFAQVTAYDIGLFEDYTQIYVNITLVVLIILFAAFCFLFRDKDWFKSAASCVLSFSKKLWTSRAFMVVIMLLAAFGTFFMECTQIYYWAILEGVDRYLYLMMPMMVSGICLVIYFFLSRIKPKLLHHISCGGVCAVFSFLLIIQNFFITDYFHYIGSNRNTNGSIDEYLENEDCLVLLNHQFYFANIVFYLKDSNNIFLSSYLRDENKYSDHYDEIDKFANGDHFYLIIDKTLQRNNEVMTILTENGIVEGYNAEEDYGYDKESGLFFDELAIKNIEDRTGFKPELVTEQALDGSTDLSLYRFERQ